MVRWFGPVVMLLLVGGTRCLAQHAVFDNGDFDFDSHEFYVREDPLPLDRTSPPLPPKVTSMTNSKKPVIKCYWCSSSINKPSKNCIFPTKNSTEVTYCYAKNSKCFTTTVTKGTGDEMLIRGCREKCVSDNVTQCCKKDLCNVPAKIKLKKTVVPARRSSNKDSYNVPAKIKLNETVVPARRSENVEVNPKFKTSKSEKPLPQTVLFFVTVLLLLQNVIKVAIL